MPGHKGLYGPQGTGLLLCARDAMPVIEGGTGSQSRRQEMPEELPDRLEAGTHNMPGIAGLLEGLRFVKKCGPESIRQHHLHIVDSVAEQLAKLSGVKMYYASDKRQQSGVLSFCVEGWDCEDLGERLAQKNVAVRAGFHCAPLAHRTVGTLETGTVRLSPSVFNTAAQAAQFGRELQAIICEKARF